MPPRHGPKGLPSKTIIHSIPAPPSQPEETPPHPRSTTETIAGKNPRPQRTRPKTEIGTRPTRDRSGIEEDGRVLEDVNALSLSLSGPISAKGSTDEPVNRGPTSALLGRRTRVLCLCFGDDCSLVGDVACRLIHPTNQPTNHLRVDGQDARVADCGSRTGLCGRDGR